MRYRFLSLTGLSIGFVLLSLIAGCDTLMGTKGDETTEEIFEVGQTDPALFNEVEYVPFLPYFTQSGDDSRLQAPQDVYVGYDELIYVVDERGLHVLDQAGRPALFLDEIGWPDAPDTAQPIREASSVLQDRRFHVYVTARRDTVVNGETWDLPVVYRISGLTTGTPTLEDVIWHPFDDDSRRFNQPNPSNNPRFQDEAVSFTSVAAYADNSILIARRGPVNDRATVFPHNAILTFTRVGLNTGRLPLSATLLNLRSAAFPSDVMTYVHPPQRQNYAAADNFMVAQDPPDTGLLQYGVLSILPVETPGGIDYQADTEQLAVASDEDNGEGFLYEEFQFDAPSDLAYAADGTNYVYVLDAAKDSLYVFTANGVEGVAPPAGSQSTTPIPVSFGGTGDGALQFDNPNGVAYLNEVVYVADTGNDRIARFKLNTDFE